MKKNQILYPPDELGNIKPFFMEEADAMKKIGFFVDCEVKPESDGVLVRGYTIWKQDNYPRDKRIIQGWEENKKTLFMEEFYPIIRDITIPTEIIDELDEYQINQISIHNQWDKIFIKSSARSLFPMGEYASVWPDTSIDFMKKQYESAGLTGPFAIRKFIDDTEIFYNEQRYWILNGNAYHPTGIIPDFVKENGKKMFEFSGSHYFTMDVAGEYIVEINPGESSDRGGDNPLDWFCDIFAKEFLYK